MRGDVAAVSIVGSDRLIFWPSRSRKRSPGRSRSMIRLIGGSAYGAGVVSSSTLINGAEVGNGAFGGGCIAVALRSADNRFTILSRGVSGGAEGSVLAVVMASVQVPSSRLIHDLSDTNCWLVNPFRFFTATGCPACSSCSGGDGAVSVCGRA